MVAPAGAGVLVTPAALFDTVFMLAVAVSCAPIFLTGGRISRAEGGLYVAYYVAYLLLLFTFTRTAPEKARLAHTTGGRVS